MRLTKTFLFSLFAFCMLTGANKINNKENCYNASVKTPSGLHRVLGDGMDTDTKEVQEIVMNETLLRPIKRLEMFAAPQKNISVIYISMDGGKTWMPFDNGIPEDATVSSFLVMDDKIFATTDYDGIYSSKEGDREWKRIDENLPENVDINAISTLHNVLVIGTLKHSIMLSKDNGRNWDNPVVQINNTAVRALHAKGNTLFAGADNGIYRSFDNGNTWQHVWKEIQVNGFTEMNNVVYAALRNGAVMTRDNGANWQYVYQSHTLHDISTDGQRIYAMTLGDGLQKSENSGLTWENANYGLGKQNLYTFEVKRFNNKIFAAQWNGIYTSENWGKNWSLIKSGLPDSAAFTTLEATRSGLIAGIGLRKKKAKQ